MIDITIIDYSIGSQRLSRICRQLRKEGYPMNDDDLYRLSPLLREHINAGPVFVLDVRLSITGVGLNRYAVLGRSSRLWSSVVPVQASLFAILPP
jgi:hypothetical protein